MTALGTQQTVTALVTTLADNSTGAISAQDVRDMGESLRIPFGQIYESANSTATTISDSVTYVEVAMSGTSLTAGAYLFDEPANGRIRYTGTNPMMLRVNCTATIITASGTAQVLRFALGKNGTADASSAVEYKHLIAADQATVTCNLLVSVVQNDYVSLMVKNTTDTVNVTGTYLTLNATGIII